MALNAYLTDVETLLHDFSLQFYGSPLSVTGLINKARLRIASETQCVRVLIPKSGAVTSVTVTTQGSNYTSPTITGGGGSGATYTATVAGGHITGITVVAGGAGNSTGSTLIITDTTGSGAVATVNCAFTASTVASQELYSFSTYNSVVQNTAGVNTIQGLLSVSVNQGTITPVMAQKSWIEMQAYMRAYNTSYTSYPYYWSQYGYGVGGSFYLWPVPSGVYGMDLDTYCLPIALASDSDPEAIPYPWTECIAYYAAYWCLMNAQRHEDAKFMKEEYDQRIMQARAFAQGPFIPSMYGEDY